MQNHLLSGGDYGNYIFKTKNSADAVRRIVYDNYMKPDFVKEATVARNEDGVREYSTPETGTWWNTIQVKFSFKTFTYNSMYKLDSSFIEDNAEERYQA